MAFSPFFTLRGSYERGPLVSAFGLGIVTQVSIKCHLFRSFTISTNQIRGTLSIPYINIFNFLFNYSPKAIFQVLQPQSALYSHALHVEIANIGHNGKRARILLRIRC